MSSGSQESLVKKRKAAGGKPIAVGKPAKEVDDFALLKEESLQDALRESWQHYQSDTSRKIKIMDLFCLFQTTLLAIMMSYGLLISNRKHSQIYSNFVSSFLGVMGILVITGMLDLLANLLYRLLVCFRIQLHHSTQYRKVIESRVFWEYYICMFIFLLSIITSF